MQKKLKHRCKNIRVYEALHLTAVVACLHAYILQVMTNSHSPFYLLQQWIFFYGGNFCSPQKQPKREKQVLLSYVIESQYCYVTVTDMENHLK